MELKYQKVVNKYADSRVLIVPLWNWNKLIGKQLQWKQLRFNRTFMELKFYKDNSNGNLAKF